MITSLEKYNSLKPELIQIQLNAADKALKLMKYQLKELITI